MGFKTVGEEATLDKVLQGASIARYGDGELNNLQGKKCTPQLMEPGLSEELREIIRAKSGNCLVGIPYVDPRMPAEKQRSWQHYMPRFAPFLREGKTYYSAFISRPDSAPWIATPEYFEKVRSLWAGKEVALVWGGYRSLYPEFLRKTGASSVKPILCSYEDAYAQIHTLEQQVVATGAKRVILCAGPTATCLAYRLSQRGIHAIDLGHIALFWKYAGGEEAIKIAPVAVLPPVEATKAQIKAHGACDISSRVSGLWWPRGDTAPEETFKREQERAGKIYNALANTPKNGKVCVFIGAGPGPCVKPLARYFERVYAFEPDFGMFGSLRRNLPLLDCANVAFYKEAVGATVGTTRMKPGERAGQWRIDITGPASVMQTTIDAMELDTLDMVVVDVGSMDGANEVLDGGVKTLNKFNPRILVL